MKLRGLLSSATVAALVVGAAVVFGATSATNAANPCNPCVAKNPCAANPCAANPCAGKNPCAVKNPCAANPCAANPCAPAAAVKLSETEASATYDKAADGLRSGYAKSGDPVASAYFKWKRYNRVPYVSETHGGRYVNNYANGAAKAYGKFEKAGVMPAGAVLAKDSFGVAPTNPCAPKQPCARKGTVQPGPLFLMEKMKAGFSPETGDWRYTMIMPNGAVFGATKGKDAAKVQFCAECHGGVSEEQDSLFFIPEEYRIKY